MLEPQIDRQIDTVSLTTEGAPADEIVAEDLLVEDVSIDGMCGVY
jgi:mycofactocin precursor